MINLSDKKIKKLKTDLVGFFAESCEVSESRLIQKMIEFGIASNSKEAELLLPVKEGSYCNRDYKSIFGTEKNLKMTRLGETFGILQYRLEVTKK